MNVVTTAPIYMKFCKYITFVLKPIKLLSNAALD